MHLYKGTSTEVAHPLVMHMQIDATLEENKALSSKYGVQGFPTLKVPGLSACPEMVVP